jgi:DNA ligase (NAD+)
MLNRSMNRNDISPKLFPVDETGFSNNDAFYPSNFISHSVELDFIRTMGFATNPFNSEATNLEDVWNAFEELGAKRDNLPYPIDGLVVKYDNNKLSSQIGVVGKTPRTWCAAKYAAEEVTTRLVGLSWQVGRTGKITPVAELEPVELAGTTVKRATLHNYKEVYERDLHYHDTLIVRKAGDIIPEVVEVLTRLRVANDGLVHETFTKEGSVALLKKCPSCGTDIILSKTGVDAICPNENGCKDQIILRMAYFCQRNNANITGLSDKLLERFVDEFGIHDIYDIYQLPFDKIALLDGFGEKSASNLKKSLENAMEFEDWKFLASLGIDGVGPEVAKLICEAS